GVDESAGIVHDQIALDGDRSRLDIDLNDGKVDAPGPCTLMRRLEGAACLQRLLSLDGFLRHLSQRDTALRQALDGDAAIQYLQILRRNLEHIRREPESHLTHLAGR